MDTHDRRHSDESKGDIASVEAGKPVIDSFGTIIFFVVVVEIILLIGLNLYQKSRISTLSDKLTADKTALLLPENRTINTQVDEVLDGTDKLKGILSSKVHWSKFYILLNGITPKNTRLTGLTVSESGAFRADGSTPSLSDLARVMVAWTQGTDSITTPFSSVALNSNGFSDQGGSRVVIFSVSGQINMGALR